MRASAIWMGTVAGVSALILSGCAKEGSDEATDGQLLTIDEVLSGQSNDPDAWADQERRLEEAIAVCMRERGWEYIPVEYDYDSPEWTEEDDLAYVKEQGFGIAYWILNPDGNGAIGFEPQWEDPNQDYVNSLSDDEMTAYYEDLWGTEEEMEQWTVYEVDEETGEEYSYTTRNGGCRGEAELEVYGEDYFNGMGGGEDYWEIVQKFYEDLALRVESDPRIVSISTKWQQCMADRNYTFENVDAMYEFVYTEFQTRVDEIVPNLYADPFEGWSEDEIMNFYDNATEDEIAALWATPDLTDDQRRQLEGILQEEIDMALANHECSTGGDATYWEVYAEIEAEFVKENMAALTAAKEELASK